MDELYYSRLAAKMKESDMKNMGPGDIRKMSAKVHQTATKKQQCEKTALKIVEFLIDRNLDPPTFLRCLRHIDQQHFQDVTEERSIGKMCGYPICCNHLPNMPAKKFHISTKQNKVYDISERKNFCSNFCYTASVHIKNQIETSPLWLRSHYSTPEFRLLENNERVTPGVEVAAESEETAENLAEEIETIESFVEESAEVFKTQQKTDQKSPSTSSSEAVKVTKKVQFCEEDNLEIYDEELQLDIIRESAKQQRNEETEQRSILKKTDRTSEISVTLPPSEETESKRPKATVPKETQLTAVKEAVVAREPPENYRKLPRKNMKTIRNESGDENELVEHIKNCLNEWLTLETFLFLYGEEHLREAFQEHDLQEDIVKSLKENSNGWIQQQKYADICKRLNLMALADRRFDSAVLENAKKPVPDFKSLKAQSNALDIKVKSFYHGGEVKIEDDEKEAEVNADKGVPAIMPLSSGSSQNALRKKVFLTSVNRVICKMMQSLDLCTHSIIPYVNSLVNTFKLQPHNIVFKPKQWSLVGLILIYILSIKDAKLKSQLGTKEAQDYKLDVLSSLKQTENSLDPLLRDSLSIDKYLVNVYLK